MPFANVTITGNTNLATNVEIVFINPTSPNSVSINLPAITQDGMRYWIKRLDDAASSVTLIASSGDIIDGSSSMSLATGQIIDIISWGNSWLLFMNISLN